MIRLYMIIYDYIIWYLFMVIMDCKVPAREALTDSCLLIRS